MPRTRWIVIGFLLAVGIVGGALNARGPFAAHPSLTYARFLADAEAGRVERIVQWRDQLEVTEGSQTMLVIVPPDLLLADVRAPVLRTAGVGFTWATIPDAWLVFYTPWVPALVLLAGSLIWIGALVRDRRARSSDSSAQRAKATG